MFERENRRRGGILTGAFWPTAAALACVVLTAVLPEPRTVAGPSAANDGAAVNLTAAQEGTVATVPIHGPVGPAAVIALRTAVHATPPPRLVILDIDSPGGLAPSVSEVIDTITAAAVPVATYVGPRARAAGLAALVFTAGHVAALAPSGQVEGVSHDMVPLTVASRAALVRAAEQAGIVPANGTGSLVAVSSEGGSLAANPVPRPEQARLVGFLTIPDVAILLVFAGAWAMVAAVAAPSLRLLGAPGVAAALIGAYGLGQLPLNADAMIVVGLGLVFMFADLAIGSYRLLPLAGCAAVTWGLVVLIDTELAAFTVSPLAAAAAALGSAVAVLGTGRGLQARERERDLLLS